MPEEIEIYPKSSPLEGLLAMALRDLWRLSMTDKRLYVEQIERLVDVFIPTFFSSKINFDLKKEIEETRKRIQAIRERVKNADPFTQDDARNIDEVNEMVDQAERMLKATLDALFEQRMMIPMQVREGRKVG